jgi:hypothetical protein
MIFPSSQNHDATEARAFWRASVMATVSKVIDLTSEYNNSPTRRDQQHAFLLMPSLFTLMVQVIQNTMLRHLNIDLQFPYPDIRDAATSSLFSPRSRTPTAERKRIKSVE